MCAKQACILIGVVCCLFVDASGQTTRPSPGADLGYQAFAKLTSTQRRQAYASLGSAGRANIVRQHVRIWLDRNKQRLSKSESALFEELITMVTPAAFESAAEKTNTLSDKVRCRLDPSDVIAAFDIFGDGRAPTNRRWTYLDRGKCWFGWAAEFFFGSSPPARP